VNILLAVNCTTPLVCQKQDVRLQNTSVAAGES
jgi:hypothetical protein